MADGQKIPFNQSINRNAQRNAEDRNAQNGKQLPCTVSAIDTTVGGAIVEAQAEVSSGLTIPKIKIPHVGGEWIRYPVQVGEKGFFISADSSLNQTSGLGGGKANLTQPANLTPLAFMPVGNINWTPTPNPNYLVMYGKTGLRLQSTVNAETYIELTAGGIAIHGDVTITGTVTANGKVIDNTHTHGGVQTGGGTTGVVS
jgi:hypothetical protein